MAVAKNYRQWMYSRLAPHIGQRVLEVGAGIGNFTEMFLDRELIVPTDKSHACVDYLKQRLSKHGRVAPSQLDLENPRDTQLQTFSFDTVICLNVLEHVRDDSAALAYMQSVLHKQGRLV